MGRKATAGNRSKGGRKKKPSTTALRTKWDYGNAVVQARRALFDCLAIKGGKAGDQVFDGIGQLWALDFLDGHHLDPELMRDTARRYGEFYWRRNADKAPKTGQPERVGHSNPSLEDTGADRRFELWIDMLSPPDKQVLDHVVCDHWFTDEVSPVVSRLVGNELMRRGRIKYALPESPLDRRMLDALLRALFVLVDGVTPMRNLRAA